MKIQEMKAEYRMQEMQKMVRARTESGFTVMDARNTIEVMSSM